MAYPIDQWERVKALFEIGLPLNEIARETEIDKGSISRKAKQSGWEKGKRQPMVAKEIKARQSLKELEAEKATLNATQRVAHDVTVAKRMERLEFFDDAHVLVAQVTINKVKIEGESATFQDLSAAANTITKAREGVLGKSPEVAVQVNNNGQQTAEVIDRSPERVRAVRAFLDSVV